MNERLPAVGLCAECMHSRQIDTSKGSRFWLCMLSERDARFPRYPRLPVLRCEGFTPRGDQQTGGSPP